MPPPATLVSALLTLRSPAHDSNIAAAATADTNSTLPAWLPLEKPDPSEWNGGSVVPVAVVSAVAATLFVGMRFYTRARILRSVMWDDWFILASLVFAIATSGGTIAQLNFGLGEHLYFAWPTFSIYLETSTFTNLFYWLSLVLTKISILLLYIRILTYDLVRLLGKILLGVVIVTHVWIIASILTTCIPLSAAWNYDPANPPLYCHPITVFWVNACLHLATDFLIFILPLPVISSMRLPRRQKLGLYVVFCLAFLYVCRFHSPHQTELTTRSVCAISIIRLNGFLHTDETPEEVRDATWSAVHIADWTCIEVHAAIITACLTTLKPLLCQLFPKLMAAAGVSPSSPAIFTSAAAEARRRRKDWEANFTTGDVEGYQRPLTIGTKSNRPKIRRDTFASLVDIKTAPTEHVEVATPTSATKLGEGEFRLAEVDAGAPLQWPPSPFARGSFARSSRLQVPPVPQDSRTRGSTVTTRHEPSYESIDRHGSPVCGRRIV